MSDIVKKSQNMMNEREVEITPPSSPDQAAFSTLFTPTAVDFIKRLVLRFDHDVESMIRSRRQRKLVLDATGTLPFFAKSTARDDPTWKIAPLPPRLQTRHIDLGDVSPADTPRLLACLQAQVSGIQADFDDGHCPTWHNQLVGWHNIYLATRNQLPGVPPISQAPVLMVRPRAWNMTEHNVLVNGKQAPGPLVDFGMVMFHNASLLVEEKSGPYFYLSKLEGSEEASLWNQVFVWTQEQLRLAHGTIKACVLIENVFASFEMDEILWELRDHSLGLNCGVWDYSASFINKFGGRTEFLLPDRNKYVSMDKPFLASYMKLVVSTCHARGAPATGGMAAVVLPDGAERQEVINRVLASKKVEVESGVDGFLLYDLGLVDSARHLWNSYGGMRFNVSRVKVQATDLLTLPTGGVTKPGLRKNVAVGILFIFAWMEGKGTFVYEGSVEDSATAEISRSQVWQWIRHGAILEEDNMVVTLRMVRQFVKAFVAEKGKGKDIMEAGEVFLEIVSMREFPEFITTLLSQSHVFLARHCIDQVVGVHF